MNQVGGLERLTRRFLGELLSRQFAQLVIDQRQQLLGGMRVALLDGQQEAGYFGHGINTQEPMKPGPC
jgi:hypothetical protein